MRFLVTFLTLTAPLLLAAAEPPETESQRYRVKAYDERCRLLATGVLHLHVAQPDEHGIRRVSGYRVFEPRGDDAYPFRFFSHELIGHMEGETIHLNLDRNVFDRNTHVSGQMIDTPEPGFEGTWSFVGWGLGPAGRIIAARAPADPTKPCLDLPEPVTAEDLQERFSELMRHLERTQNRPSEQQLNPYPDQPYEDDSKTNDDRSDSRR